MDWGYTEQDKISFSQHRKTRDHDIKTFWQQGQLTMDEQHSLKRYTELDPATISEIHLDDPRFRSVPLPQTGHMIFRGKCKLGNIPVSITAFKHFSEYMQNHNGAVKTGIRDWRELAQLNQMPTSNAMGAVLSVRKDGAWIKIKNHGLLIWVHQTHTLVQHFWYMDEQTVEMTNELYPVKLRQY